MNVGRFKERPELSNRKNNNSLRTTSPMTNTLLKCEQFRAGQITNQVVFDSEQQASDFVAQMQRMEPDIFWRIEPVDAKLVWN